MYATIGSLVFLALSGPAEAEGRHTLWLETEMFEHLGGWVRDSQFIDQMGSSFLLAIGLRGPVEDAWTNVDIPAAGPYRLWVRCHDWLPEHSPGRFQIVLADKTVEHVFGQSKTGGWVWEDGGVHQLPAGKLQVRLKDLTGHYSRCDVIVLTSDLDYRPPAELEKLQAERIARGGL
ncbi:MAG: NADH-dependent oxidoreductase, partial [Thermoguttaceae bacterium]|nr:NADH-dependent oxidoreductase [Thermoguttaceae bacterium]